MGEVFRVAIETVLTIAIIIVEVISIFGIANLGMIAIEYIEKIRSNLHRKIRGGDVWHY